MTLEEIFKFIEQFGVKAEIIGDVVKFHDLDNGETMTIYETKKQEHPLSKIGPSRFFIVHDKDKMLRLEFEHFRNEQGISIVDTDLMLSRIQYGTHNEDHIVDFHVSPRCKRMELSSYYRKAPNVHEYDRTKIVVEDDNYILVDVNDKSGDILDDEQILTYLTPTEMLDVINNNKCFDTFMSYYGALYPDIKQTYDAFKEKVSGMIL